MGRIAENILTLEDLPGGGKRLFGQHLGKQIRRQSRTAKGILALEQLKQSLEKDLHQSTSTVEIRKTWLSEDQLRQAEAAMLRAKTRPIVDLVQAGLDATPDVENVLWPAATELWKKSLTERNRHAPTVGKNITRITAFSATLPGTYVHETTPDQVERWVYRAKALSANTRLTDAAVIRTFFNFAVKARWIAQSPVQIDFEDLSEQSGPIERPRILSLPQCQGLLDAAANLFDGIYLPFVTLATWCFLRHPSEVCRVYPEHLHLAKGHAYFQVDPHKRGSPRYRDVAIPENARNILIECRRRDLLPDKTPIFFARSSRWDALRDRAGILELGERSSRHGQYPIVKSDWQENILRHTGLSYFFQKTGDMKETVRQAGNSDETAFKHYLKLPVRGGHRRFYAMGPRFA